MDVSKISKILYITHPESDYGGAFLFNGLCQYFGPENVYCYPPKQSYHGRTHEYTLPGRTPGQTGALPWMPNYPEAWGDAAQGKARLGIWVEGLEKAVCELLRDGFFQLVILESLRGCARMAYDQIQHAAKDLPLVVHDGEDYIGISPHIPTKTRLVLKREVPHGAPERAGSMRILPFPFSFPGNHSFIIQKDDDTYRHDIVFMAGRTCDKRQEVADIIRQSSLNHYVVLSPDSPRDGVTPLDDGLRGWWQYLTLMANSRCSASVRGFGWDTCRAWEAPSVTLMVRDRLGIQIPYDFEDRKNALLCDSAQDYVSSAMWAKENQADAEALRHEGIAHLRKYHTNVARVTYMLESLSSL